MKMRDGTGLKAIRLYDPASNLYHGALLGIEEQAVIGFSEDRPYLPVGGYSACKEIADTDGLAEGKVWLFQCWHCHDEVYRLGPKPD